MNNDTKTTNLTDTQKVAMCIGFLKGLIQNGDYYASVNIESVKKFINEIG